jgi:hypothetical protein
MTEISKVTSVNELVYVITEMCDGYKDVDRFQDYLMEMFKIRQFATNEMENKREGGSKGIPVIGHGGL